MRYHVSLCLLVLAVLMGACLSGDGGGTTSGSPLASVDHTLAWEPAWTISEDAGIPYEVRGLGFFPVELGLGRTLTVRRSGGVDVFDVTTGRLVRTLDTSWGSPPKTFQVGNLLLDYRTDDIDGWPDESVRHNGYLTAYDMISGSHMWQQQGTVDQFLPAGSAAVVDSQYSSESFLAFTERGLVRNEEAWSTGRDRRTGRTTWTQEREQPRCREGQPQLAYAATRYHSLTLQWCEGERTVIEALDPETGRIAWQRDLGRLKDVVISVSPDLIGIGGEDRGRRTVSIFDDSGEQLAAATVDDPAFKPDELTMVGRSGNSLLFHSRETVYALPVGGHAPSRWGSFNSSNIPHPFTGGVVVSVPTGGESSYYVLGLGRPSQSVVADLAGRRQVLPLPGGGEVVGVASDLVITQREVRGRTLFSALRLRHRQSVSPALGGVPPTDWPDACALLSDHELADIGRGYVRLPVRGSREIFGTRLPRASACRFATPSADENDIFEISVQWVTADPTAAEQLAEGDLHWTTPVGAVRALGPHTYLYRPGVEGDEGFDSAVIKVVGRQVLLVSGHDSGLIVRAAAHLRGNSGTARI